MCGPCIRLLGASWDAATCRKWRDRRVRLTGVRRQTDPKLVQPPPPIVGSLPVVCYTRIDWRHEHTGACSHWVGGELLGPLAGLVVCRDAAGYYLFGCDVGWEAITDTWHDTLADALDQAESEYKGSAATWEHVV